MCFFSSEQKEEKGKGEGKVGGGKGGVAPISPHVGNLSHINLTPNFHTCSSTCWKSSNSLTHTHPQLLPHAHATERGLAVDSPRR